MANNFLGRNWTKKQLYQKRTPTVPVTNAFVDAPGVSFWLSRVLHSGILLLAKVLLVFF